MKHKPNHEDCTQITKICNVQLMTNASRMKSVTKINELVYEFCFYVSMLTFIAKADYKRFGVKRYIFSVAYL